MSGVMSFLVANIHIILIAIVVIAAIVIFATKFMKLSPSEQNARIKLILLDLTLKAEAALGSKTGQAKRAQVYSALKEKLPILTLFISQKQFDKLLDDTLDEMRKMLSNEALVAALNLTE